MAKSRSNKEAQQLAEWREGRAKWYGAQMAKAKTPEDMEALRKQHAREVRRKHGI